MTSQIIFLINHLRRRYSLSFFFVFVLVVATGVGIFVLPSQTLAQASDVISQRLTNLPAGFGINTTIQWLFNLLKGLACNFIRFAIVAIAIMMIIYGIMFLKSRGSPQGMTSAKKALLWGLLGAIVIFAVFTIILSVAALIGVDYPILRIISC